jgi:hypothetical protein
MKSSILINVVAEELKVDISRSKEIKNIGKIL